MWNIRKLEKVVQNSVWKWLCGRCECAFEGLKIVFNIQKILVTKKKVLV
jgi:hypothetical protein